MVESIFASMLGSALFAVLCFAARKVYNYLHKEK